MGFNPQAYQSLFVPQGPKSPVIDNHMHYNQPALTDLFRRAGRGEDVVTAQLSSELLGQPARVFRSREVDAGAMVTRVTVDLRADIAPIAAIVERKVQNGSLSADDEQDLRRRIQALSDKTGLGPGVLGDHVALIETELADRKNGKVTSANKLDQLLGMGATENSPPSSPTDMLAEIINLTVSETKNGSSKNIPSPSGEKTLVVQQLSQHQDAFHIENGFNEHDLPPNPPIGTADQHEFLTAIHETAHAHFIRQTRDSDGKVRTDFGLNLPAGTPSELEEQMGEIAGDLAVMRLEDPEFSAIQNYYMQSRHVSTFSISTLMGISEHDTATAVRIYQETGRIIDIKKFNEEKVALGDKIRQELDGRSSSTTGNMMSAVQHILESDGTETDPAKKLSSIQRAEAESYLEDATALGYSSNADYANAPRTRANVGLSNPSPMNNPVQTPA